jgi:hypothetical protein
MIFRTKLDGPATHTTAGSRRGICVMPDNVSRLGAAVECSNPPKGRRHCAYKAPGVSLAGTSLSSRPSLCALLYFSFAICSSPV